MMKAANWITIGPADKSTKIPAILKEHLDSVTTVMTQQCKPMEDDTITEQEIKRHLNKLKCKRQEGTRTRWFEE